MRKLAFVLNAIQRLCITHQRSGRDQPTRRLRRSAARADRTLALLLALALLAPAPAAAREVPFSPQMWVDGSLDGALTVDSADLDGDGDLDVLAGSKFEGQFAWYENAYGDGDSWSQSVLGDDYGIVWDAIGADINSDGKMDILVSHGSSHLDWWENVNGDGSVWHDHNIADGQEDHSLQAVDLDGDGDLDVVAGDMGDDDVDWWENTDGAGLSWDGHTIDGDFDGVISEYAGDIDGDGDLDLFAAGFYCDCLAWWENTGGALAWEEHPVRIGYLGASAVWLDDINQDGTLDLLAAAAHSDLVTWWNNAAGDGLGMVEHPIRSGFDYADSVETADMDGDGDQDVLSAATYAGVAAWFENGAGWSQHNLATASGSGANEAHAADIDGDGDLDALIAYYYSDRVSWRENIIIHRSAFYLDYQHVADGFDGARDLALGDLDGDGDLDILGAASGASDLAWWEISGLPASVAVSAGAAQAAESLPPALPAPDDPTLSDGLLDAPPYVTAPPEEALPAPAPPEPVSPQAALAPEISFEQHMIDAELPGASAVAIADIDGDGRLDAAATSYWSGQVVWYANWLGDASYLWKHIVADDLPTVGDMVAADLDSDGDIDIAAVSEYSTPVVMFENVNNYAAEWPQIFVDNSYANPNSLAAADIDRDGDLDLLGTMNNSVDRAVVWWENLSGSGHAWERHVIDPTIGADAIAAGDMDGDGVLDVIAASRTEDRVYWYENLNRDATTWFRHTAAGGDGARSFQAVDLDMDNDLDVVTAAGDADALSWMENLSGSGLDWIFHDIYGTFDWPFAIVAGDIDRDADLDLVTASFNSDMVSLHLNSGGQFALKTGSTAAQHLSPGEKKAVLIIRGFHRGRNFDADAEVNGLVFRLEHSPGDALSQVEANHVIERLQIYRDDGSWTFDPAQDTLIASVDNLVVTSGWTAAYFPDGSAQVQFSPWQAYNLFVVLEAAHDSNLWPVHQCILTHWSVASTAEDSSNDLPLLLEYEPHIDSGVIHFDTIPLYLPMLIR